MAETVTRFEELVRRVEVAAAGGTRFIAAIDGRCASGKTTLAEKLSRRLGCAVFHMDDFFLRPEQRTEERLAEPGGNVDRERFLKEVLSPLGQGEKLITFRPFDCSAMSLADPVSTGVGKIALVEGSYSCHPDLRELYDLRIFVDIAPEAQRKRIIGRNAERADAFFTKWIPLEEKYFSKCAVREAYEVVFLPEISE